MKGLFWKITRFLSLKRIFGACLLPLFAFLFCIFVLNTPISALSISSTTHITPKDTSSLVIQKDGGSDNTFSFSSSNSQSARFFSTSYSSYINFSRLSYANSSTIPAQSIVSFNILFEFSGDNNLERPYTLPTTFIVSRNTAVQVLDYDCSESSAVYNSGNKYSLSCEVRLYFVSGRSSSVPFLIETNFSASSNNNQQNPIDVDVFLSYLSVYSLNYDSLSSNDKDWLSDDFISALQEAQTNAQDEANEHVKDQTTTQTQTSESTANTEGGDSEQAGMTLLQAFSGFVSAITNVSPAQSCDFDLDFSGYHEGLSATVDMCSLSPPAGLTFIGSILLILFCVPLSISTVRRMISLFRSFQT